MCMIQDSFADCSAVGTSQRDKPIGPVLSVGESIYGQLYTHLPMAGETLSDTHKRQPTHYFVAQSPLGGIYGESVIFTRENSGKAKKKTRRRTSCKMRKRERAKDKVKQANGWYPSARSILKLLIHLILL
jgi:hypothetical protein